MGNMVLHLTYSSDYPLIKKYWENPSINEDLWERTFLLCDAILKPRLYEMLVIPVLYRKKGKPFFIYRTGTVFLKGVDRKDIESFMLSSKIIVSPEAQNAAFYSIEKAYGYRISTKEILVKDEKVVN